MLPDDPHATAELQRILDEANGFVPKAVTERRMLKVRCRCGHLTRAAQPQGAGRHPACPVQ
jgi:hypothetical protein